MAALTLRVAAGGALAAPTTLTIPAAAGALAAPTTLPIPAAGAVLVRMTGGLFKTPRMLMVPAGTRLPHGVHAVAKVAAVAGGAPGGSGCRGAMRWALAAVAAPAAGDDGNDDDDDDDDKPHQLAVEAYFYEQAEAYAVAGLELLSKMEPPARLIGKADLIKDDLEKALNKIRAKEDTDGCDKAMMLVYRSIVELCVECVRARARNPEDW